MRDNFDAKKSPLERRVERAAAALERTHPEQTADAMEDYASALAALGNSKDPLVLGVIAKLKRLYIYPNRQEHNSMLIDLHDLKELLYETRIDHELKQREKTLGEQPKNTRWPWLIGLAIALYFLIK